MEKSVEILDELREISPFLAQNPVGLPFRVPAGYFNDLAVTLADKVQDALLLPDYQANSYKVPEGYFESLAGNILEKIRYQAGDVEVRGELETVAPFLNSISRENIYQVPAGYFEGLNPVPVKQEAKVVPFRRARRWMQYAAAAVISGVLVTGAFLYTDSGSNDLRGYEKTDLPAELTKVSEGELASYLDAPDHTQTASNELVSDVKNNIHTVSDEELGQYLADHADDLVTTVTN